jgi:alpha-L-fucosidase 2
MKFFFITIFFLSILSISCKEQTIEIDDNPHDLKFEKMPTTWDEGIPLGNGMLGALIWEKDGKLRFSLDRADLWDLRPMENLNTEKWKFSWVYEQWKNNDYKNVQDQFDKPYDKLPAPTKIPAGALEFDLQAHGKPQKIQLHIDKAICQVTWNDSKYIQIFVHATKPVGWFRFSGFDQHLLPELIPPPYQGSEKEKEEINSVTGQNLSRLGYEQGVVTRNENSSTYTQAGWGGFSYQIHVVWKISNEDLVGCWSISSEYPDWDKQPEANALINEYETQFFEEAFSSHSDWWNKYWEKSGIKLPDPLLERQWYLEMYKFGAVARDNTPPISLQAVWTADNGRIPPWKGDFHHDLNTQLSYWPAYSGNHLELEMGFINWLWKYRETFKKYTSEFYGTNGLNVPGVTTLTGEPMGGWIQYSFGPTVSAWLGHHFYFHWRYTMDRKFLEGKAYPWIRDVAVYFDELSVKGKDGKRKLPLSSSPEIFDNSREAWFDEITNYDLALIRWTYTKAAELAEELGLKEESLKWVQSLSEWPDFAIDEKEGLMFSASVPYFESHRHFSHLMAIHPLGLLDMSQGETTGQVISNTIENLDAKGPKYWTGYSYSWQGNLKARALDGDGAAKALKIFAEAFCLPNSFHVNGDQSGKGYSSMTYRPFTLEGNFAFASGINEMLIQSHTGIIKLFPAIPEYWKDIEFNNLRTEGAFLISSELKDGKVIRIEINPEKGGIFNLHNPFPDGNFRVEGAEYDLEGDRILIVTKPDQIITFNRKDQ